MTAQRRYELTDEEWERIKGYFPEREAGQKGRPRNEDRPILNGILWIVRSGAAWRDFTRVIRSLEHCVQPLRAMAGRRPVRYDIERVERSS